MAPDVFRADGRGRPALLAEKRPDIGGVGRRRVGGEPAFHRQVLEKEIEMIGVQRWRDEGDGGYCRSIRIMILRSLRWDSAFLRRRRTLGFS